MTGTLSRLIFGISARYPNAIPNFKMQERTFSSLLIVAGEPFVRPLFYASTSGKPTSPAWHRKKGFKWAVIAISLSLTVRGAMLLSAYLRYSSHKKEKDTFFVLMDAPLLLANRFFYFSPMQVYA